MLRTLNCTGCTVRRATLWGDHVHHDSAGAVIAGWCKECRPGAAGLTPGNCQGAWFPQLGLMAQTGKEPRRRIMVLREDDARHHGLHDLQ